MQHDSMFWCHQQKVCTHDLKFYFSLSIVANRFPRWGGKGVIRKRKQQTRVWNWKKIIKAYTKKRADRVFRILGERRSLHAVLVTWGVGGPAGITTMVATLASGVCPGACLPIINFGHESLADTTSKNTLAFLNLSLPLAPHHISHTPD